MEWLTSSLLRALRFRKAMVGSCADQGALQRN